MYRYTAKINRNLHVSGRNSYNTSQKFNMILSWNQIDEVFKRVSLLCGLNCDARRNAIVKSHDFIMV